MSHFLNDETLVSLKPLIQDLMHREYVYLVNDLSKHEQEEISPEWVEYKDKSGNHDAPFPAQHCMCSMEIGFVIAGLKPCSIISHGNLKTLGKTWYENIFLPWQMKYREQLDDVHLVGRLTPPGEVARFMDDKANAHFGNEACLVYRSDHPLSDKVVDVFGNKPKATSGELQKAFGYPAQYGPLNIVYQLQPPVASRFGVQTEQELCCCMALEYTTDGDISSLIRCGQHFAAYKKVGSKIGIPIGMDVGQADVPPNVLALLWLAASNGSIKQYVEGQKEEGACWRRPDTHPSLEQTAQYMQQYARQWEQMKNM
ncbi:MAG: hypothetical protein SGILL_010752 [Bacillariaceae sp.]